MRPIPSEPNDQVWCLNIERIYMYSDNSHLKNNNPKRFTKARQGAAFQSKNAEFLGWQTTADGEIFPIYNIIDRKHPRYGSTVSEHTLRELKLKVPATPPKPLSYPLFKLPHK
jgi:hypothetical protein